MRSYHDTQADTTSNRNVPPNFPALPDLTVLTLPPRLTRLTPSSWRTKNAGAVVDFLKERGFAPIPTRSERELTRLANPSRSLFAIVYHTGAVVAQGRDRALLAGYLDRYASDPEARVMGGAV